MSNQMKVIMESWRKFSTLDSILKEETDVSQMNIDKLADIQAKHSGNSKVQQKIQTALVSDSEVQKIASMLLKAMQSGVESDSESTTDATKDLEAAGLEEGVLANFVHSLTAAFGQAAVGNMEEALELIGLGKIAKTDSKVLGAAVILMGAAAGATGKVDPIDVAKVAEIGGRIATGGINAISPEDMGELASAVAGVDGGKKAE